MNKYLVIGNPIEHSLSPLIHNYWIKKNNLDVVCIVTTINEKVSCVVNIRKEITNKLNAVELVNLISTKVDGKPGGGRPDMAQSGGQNVKGVQNAINQLKKYLINK